MMQAFLKGDKLPAQKASTSASSTQKGKEKKQREKPVPWVEKVS